MARSDNVRVLSPEPAMSESRRVFVPKSGDGKGALEAASKLVDDPVVQKLSQDVGKGRNIGVSNARSVGRILKNVLKRKKPKKE